MPLEDEILANIQLEQAGSVMAPSRQPSPLRQKLRGMGPTAGPALETGMDLLDFILSQINPTDAGGGGSAKAVIAPTSNKVLQGLIQQLRKAAPKLMGEAEDTARTAYPYMVGGADMPGASVGRSAWGTHQAINPLASNININREQPATDLMSTLAHELKHFITEPKLALKNPTQSLETAQQITGMLPPPQAVAMGQYAPVLPPAMLGRYQGRPADLLAKLSKPGTGVAPRGVGRTVAESSDAAKLRAYNESLSYLTEALLGGGMGGDPMLQQVAEGLGQGIK